ncbi:hypothetical protein [Paenibacillus harenae]|uniref:hypothetical protein n=1 Tax=Paenibacillus harenae TaxID=306543 RepID=UPI00279054DE|nr:hypothetical protein [Paenibacillus harenae]MDQ0059993.1 hypothetical protein [Paenibacillus harenae]
MFEKLYSRRLMKALYRLFISIRAKPDNPLHIEIIKAFQYHFDKDIKFYKLNGLIRDIKKLEENDYTNTIIKTLKKHEFFKTRYFTLIRISRSISVLKAILEKLLIRIDSRDFDKVRIMASAVHNYPDFLINEYRMKSEEFWEGHINYYTRTCEEDFLKEWEYLFKEFYPNN